MHSLLLGAAALVAALVTAGCRSATCVVDWSTSTGTPVLARFDRDGRPVPIECRVGPNARFKVLVDTGWAHPAVLSRASNDASLAFAGHANGVGGSDGRRFRQVTAPSIAAPDWKLSGPTLLVEDDGIAPVACGADLLLGIGQFVSCGVVRISLSEGTITLLPGQETDESEPYAELVMRAGVPCVTAWIGDTPIELAIDTGSDAPVAIPRGLMRDSDWLNEREGLTARASWGTYQWSRGVLLSPARLGGHFLVGRSVYVAEVDGVGLPMMRHIGRRALMNWNVYLDARNGRAVFRRADDAESRVQLLRARNERTAQISQVGRCTGGGR